MKDETLRVSSRISPALKKALEDKARELDRSESYIINKALEAYLKERENERNGQRAG